MVVPTVLLLASIHVRSILPLEFDQSNATCVVTVAAWHSFESTNEIPEKRQCTRI